MTHLIDQLLILARADAGASALKLAPVDVREPLSHVLSKTLPLANGKRVSLMAELPSRTPPSLEMLLRCEGSSSF